MRSLQYAHALLAVPRRGNRRLARTPASQEQAAAGRVGGAREHVQINRLTSSQPIPYRLKHFLAIVLQHHEMSVAEEAHIFHNAGVGS